MGFQEDYITFFYPNRQELCLCINRGENSIETREKKPELYRGNRNKQQGQTEVCLNSTGKLLPECLIQVARVVLHHLYNDLG